MKERNLGKARAFRCKFPRYPLAVLHAYSDALRFINHKLLLSGVYFCSGLTSQPRPWSRVQAPAEELPGNSPTTASRAVEVPPVPGQPRQAVKGLPGRSHIPADQQMWRTWPWVSYCPVMGFLDTFNPKNTVGATCTSQVGQPVGCPLLQPWGFSSPVQEAQIYYPPRQMPAK